MYGFGSILPGTEDPKNPKFKGKNGDDVKPIKWASNCFAMNGDASNPQVKGVEGVLRTYRETTPLVEMYCPSIFTKFL